MEYSRLLNNISLLAISFLLFICCTPRESKLELQIKKQAIGESFSFADYCEAEYDSIYLIHPYDNEDEIYSLPYKMSQRLRDKCSYTMDDTFVRILFIEKGTVKAYTEIGNWSAYFSTPEIIKNGPLYTFDQQFVLDENRYIHLYNE